MTFSYAVTLVFFKCVPTCEPESVEQIRNAELRNIQAAQCGQYRPPFPPDNGFQSFQSHDFTFRGLKLFWLPVSTVRYEHSVQAAPAA